MATSGVDARRAEWPLVGRDDELAVALEAATRGDGVVLIGAAGVGKTRLARELVAARRSAGASVEWVVATETAARVPLGAVAHLVPVESVGDDRRSDAGGRDSTLQRIATAVQRAHDRSPLLLAVDDAHLLDDASALLVQLLASRAIATVVATVRSGVTVPDAISWLWKDGGATLLALQALSRDESDALVRGSLGGQVDGATLQLLWEVSAGNALYLRELVDHGRRAGLLRQEHAGWWTWRGRPQAGDRLQELIEHRMGELAADELAAVELVATGEPLPAEAARALGIAEVAERLEQRGLVTSAARGRIELGMAHPLFGEVIRSRLSAARAERVRRQLATSIEELRAPTASDRFRAALWRAELGDHDRPDRLRAAARRAHALWASPIAERLARAALASGPDAEAGHLLAEAIADQGRADEALATWQQIASYPCSDQLRATIAVSHASLLHFRCRRVDDAAAVLQAASAVITDPQAQALIDSTFAVFRTTSGARLVDEPADRGTPLDALALGIERATHGRLASGRETVERALSRSGEWEPELPSIALFLQLVRCWTRVMQGEIDAAEVDAARGDADAVAARADFPRSGWCVLRGWIALVRGEPELARAVLHEGIAISGSNDRGWHRALHTYAVMTAALAGDAEEAEAHLGAAEQANPSFDAVFGSDVSRARSWIHACRGDVSAARDAALAAAETARVAELSIGEAWALHDACRFGAAGPAVERLGELAAQVDSELVRVFHEHAAARGARDGSALNRVAARFGELGCTLFAAEASTAAARQHLAHGRRASASAAREHARQLVERCGSVRTPALAWEAGAPELTARERQVAQLAAGGATSREIAGALGVTTRTVDNLLGRVYTKLGVTGRHDLADVLGRSRAAT